MLRSRLRPAGVVFVALLLNLAARTAASAQSIEIVHVFQTRPANPAGELLEVAPHVYLGASRAGGAYDNGTVYLLFRRADGTWDSFVLHSFAGADGSRPASGLIRATNGHFYGTTESGGRFDDGTVYRISSSGAFTSLHSFNETDGSGPLAPLVEGPDGFLWGSTARQGVGGYGTIFKVSPSGTHSVVRYLTAASGSEIVGPLVRGRDGRLYGVTAYGGTPDLPGGTIFRITTTGSLTVLHRFASNESGPKWMREGLDGNLYGVSFYGGAVSAGLFFRVALTGTVTYIKSFTPTEPGDMASPFGAPVQLADGMFYGAAHGSLNSDAGGGVYSMTLTGKARAIGTLGGAFGVSPTGVIAAADGTLVGTTPFGERPLPPLEPNYGVGAAFSVKPGQPVALLYRFGQSDPQHPAGRLTPGADGRLYGTTCVGGVYNRGTIYRLDDTGPTTLHSFSGPDGWCPISGLTQATDGVFYGTTLLGSPQPPGRIFRLMPDSGFSEVWRPPSEDLRFLFAAPVAGPDGALYVTASGILAGSGGVLRIGLDGTVTLLAKMDALGMAWVPTAPLTLAGDGNFYGASSLGDGGIYRLSPTGVLSEVRALPLDHNVAIRNGLVQGADGRLFGSIQQGGAAGLGSVYASTLGGEVSVLHEFDGSDGALPWGELFETSPGRFLGMTSGVADTAFGQFGSIFEVTADGGFSIVHRFSGGDGANPFSTLTRAGDGSIYGTTYRGGPLGGGVIFRIVPAPAVR